MRFPTFAMPFGTTPCNFGGARVPAGVRLYAPLSRLCRVGASCSALALVLVAAVFPALTFAQDPRPYRAEVEWIEVLFSPDSRVRVRGGELVDLRTEPEPGNSGREDAGRESADPSSPIDRLDPLGPLGALAGIEEVLADLPGREWQRNCWVPEAEIDQLTARGVANTGSDLYDMNNVYRLRLDTGSFRGEGTAGDDLVWEVAAKLEALPGVLSARPVPLPVAPPTPPNYAPAQEYRAPAAWTPTGTNNEYFWLAAHGDGDGTHVCDIEYGWNYDHADISKAQGSQINQNVSMLFPEHGTAVIGMLVADDNGWGVTGLCPGARLRTCGSYFGSPTPQWNPSGAITVATNQLPPGSVLLLEQQWDYDGAGGMVPIEWWLDYAPNPQTANSVFAAIQLATANLMTVVEAGGNGGVDTDNMNWVGNSSGAIIVGAGGAYPGGAYGSDDLERMSFSSYGSRYDVQGWGEDVYTTGYGDLYVEGATPNYDYTAIFAGTSSASAHVAAVATCYNAFHTPIFGAPLPSTVRTLIQQTGTPQRFGIVGNIGPRPDMQRMYLSFAPWPLNDRGEFGDAPEGVLAYPDNGVIGAFPTVFAPTTPYGYIVHADQPAPILYLGSSLDYENEGNGGIGFPADFLEYDADECWDSSPSDDGLLYPAAFTIQGTNFVQCTSGSPYFGAPCGTAAWGTDIDLELVNETHVTAWLNVIVDWNRDGQWGGGTNTCGHVVRELILENVPIPNTGPTPVLLSSLVANLPPLSIGPEDGYVWMRVTLSSAPINNAQAWDGSGAYLGDDRLGETEDYLIRVDSGSSDVAEDGEEGSGNGGQSGNGSEPADLIVFGAYPNPFHAATTLRFELGRETRVNAGVFDVQGRVLRHLVDGVLSAGEHRLEWDGRTDEGGKAPSGLYFCQIREGAESQTVKLYLAQ